MDMDIIAWTYSMDMDIIAWTWAWTYSMDMGIPQGYGHVYVALMWACTGTCSLDKHMLFVHVHVHILKFGQFSVGIFLNFKYGTVRNGTAPYLN
jgi:hypothetical protein